VLTPYTQEEDLVEYAKKMACELHSGVIRRNTLPYTAHLEAVVQDFSNIITPESKYFKSGIASAWLHDSVEDCNEVLDVFNPHQELSEKRTDAVYLNDLLLQAGLPGHWTCYMVDKMTHRRGGYDSYMWKKFLFSSDGEDHNLDVLSLILKMCDRKNNMLPNECIICTDEVETYKRYEEVTLEERAKFHEKKKVALEMEEVGHIYDPKRFHQALTHRYERSKIDGAFNNITAYIPATEAKLIMFKEKDYSGLFLESAFRDLLKDLASYSMHILFEGKVLNKRRVLHMRKYFVNSLDEESYCQVVKEVKEELLRTGKLPGIDSISK
jgi:hypothetical protein